jgi:hypothetical protein
MAQTTALTMVPTTEYTGVATINLVGDKQPAASYISSGRNVQTLIWTLQNNFAGTIKVQASLATTPTVFDWFDVYTLPTTTSSTSGNQSGYYNLIGNYVWIRINITNWTAGNILKIAMTY